ncbi:MAG: T9SS type A sorting domain-containing protein [Bacteroidales bacterium]|nr:T9SS type A sorting domain-containing protein [Bacteroidales bacterium]
MKKYILLIASIFISGIILAGTQYYRASYRDDPTTTIVIGWCDNGTSTNATVYYGTEDYSTVWSAYPMTHTVDRTVSHRGKTNRFARLTGLTPNTVYYFVIKDDQGTSSRMSFKTLPDDPNIPIMFINGGDTRTGASGFEFETDLCVPRRQKGFDLVAKIRPDFVAFSGDYIFAENFLVGGDQLWSNWLSDWQRTIGGPETKGRLIPIVGVYGNHEDNGDLYNLFDIPNSSNYYSFSAGKLFRFYCLNTDLECDQTQLDWFTNDLDTYTDNENEPYWKFIQYHIPLAPHGEYSVLPSLINCWATLFADHNIRLSMDGHSHVMKITNPISPGSGAGSDNGFITDNETGCVYIGEGSWGAPMRNVYTDAGGKAYNWTYDQGKFPGFNIITVHKQKYEIRSVNFDNTNLASVQQVSQDDPVGTIPSGLDLWVMSGNNVFTLYNNAFVFSDDAKLVQLYTSSGSLVPNFSATTYNYEVELAPGTTTVPTTFAVPNHAGATVQITNAQNTTGSESERTTTILVTAENQTNTQEYTIVFSTQIAADATLSNLTTSLGELAPSFSPTTYNYTVDLPSGTTTIPTVTATPNDPSANVQTNQAASTDGTATVVVTSADLSQTNTYTVDFVVAAADAKMITSFSVPGEIQAATINQAEFTIVLHMSTGTNVTNLIPTITYIGQSISPLSGVAQDFTNPVTYTVTAADLSTVEYSVSVSFEDVISNNANLASLSVSPEELTPTFNADVLHYDVTLDVGTENVNILATAADPNAEVKIFPPFDLMGSTAQRTGNVIVIAQDETTNKIYSIVFNGANSITSEKSSGKYSSVYPNPVTNEINIAINEQFGDCKIKIHNGFGQNIYEKEVSKGQEEIKFDLSSYPSGTYFVVIINNEKSDLHRIIKIK